MKKRILSLLLAVATTATLLFVPGAVMVSADVYSDVKLGDFDPLDGEITTTDARCILQACVGKWGPDGEWGIDSMMPKEKLRADVDQDGNVTTTDARLVLQLAAGKIARFPSPDDYTGNTYYPAMDQAGSSFATLDDLKKLDPAATTDSTKELGYIAFTTEKNPGLPFNVACYLKDGHATALLPAGVDLTALIPDINFEGDKILVGDQPLTADKAIDFSSKVTLTLVAKDGSKAIVTVEIETLNTGIPSMAITDATYPGAEAIDHDEYSTVSIYLAGGTCDYAPAEPLQVTGRIKGRGNSSWKMDEKKSYTVKLDEKAALLDMDQSKNWVIVGNYEDKSLMRNLIAEYFSEATETAVTMKMRPVDMWIDGEYWGTYNLGEKIEIENARIDITDIKKPDNEDFEDLAADKVGYVLEFDAHVMEANAGGMLDDVRSINPNDWESLGWSRWTYKYNDLYAGEEREGYVYYNPDTDETFFQLSYCNGKWVTIKEPGTENLTHNPAMREYIFKQVKELDSALRNRNNDMETLQAKLDIKSFAQWVITEELMDNTDASFHSSVYMYKDVDGKFTFGPVWDFDRSTGNCSYWKNNVGSLIGGTDWGRYVFETEVGKTILKETWATFKKNTADWEKDFDGIKDLLGETYKVNFDRWQILGKFVYYNSDDTAAISTYTGQVTYLKDFLRTRYQQLDNYIASR